jgi:Peptidase family M28
MEKCRHNLMAILLLVIQTVASVSFSQSAGLKSITEKGLRYHLDFLGSGEFRGRAMPSPELDIATLYLADWAGNAGLKPILENGTFYQMIPLTVTSVFQPETRIRVSGKQGEKIYYYDRSFGGNFSVTGTYSGVVVFAGSTFTGAGKGSDDLKDIDLSGKVVMVLDCLPPGSLAGPSYYYRLNQAAAAIRARGASAMLSVVSPEREEKLNAGFNIFKTLPSGRMGTIFDSQKTDLTHEPAKQDPGRILRPELPFERAEISHAVAAGILGVDESEIDSMFRSVRQGERLAAAAFPDVRVQLDVTVETKKSFSRNVIGVVPGSDPVLRNEYVVICGHPDGLGLREGEVLAGADDNATATVALMEIAGALLADPPERSVIIAWFTGEEEIMNGSHYFINNPPVPPEKISACLDMDMLGRNNPDSLFLVGSDLLSSELDASINRMNRRWGINFGFDYRYSSVSNPEHVYFRSDHYPFIRFGIPSVWFFSGFTPDYHTPRDVNEFIDYGKFLKITRLVYLTAYDICNMKEMLKLDVNPKVTSRGKHNLTEKSLFTGK